MDFQEANLRNFENIPVLDAFEQAMASSNLRIRHSVFDPPKAYIK